MHNRLRRDEVQAAFEQAGFRFLEVSEPGRPTRLQGIVAFGPALVELTGPPDRLMAVSFTSVGTTGIDRTVGRSGLIVAALITLMGAPWTPDAVTWLNDQLVLAGASRALRHAATTHLGHARLDLQTHNKLGLVMLTVHLASSPAGAPA